MSRPGRDTLQSRLDQALTTEFGSVPVKRITDVGDPGLRITEVAHNEGVDLIMMPTHGLGLFRTLLIGSATSKVLHDAKCPVWTAAHAEQQRNGRLPRTILCAVDGRPESGALLTWAANFSTRVGATLKLLHVVGPMPDSPSFEREGALEEQVASVGAREDRLPASRRRRAGTADRRDWRHRGDHHHTGP